METKQFRILLIDIFKNANKLNLTSMKDILIPNINYRVLPNNITVRLHNSTTYGDKNLMRLGQKNWKKIPQNIKSETIYNKLKGFIALWS